MSQIHWLWVTFISLAWWQMVLLGAYFIYFLYRSYHFWYCYDYKDGLWAGYKYAIFDGSKYFKVYHLIRMILDIPSTLVGLFFPIIDTIFDFKLYEFKDKSKKLSPLEELAKEEIS